MRRLKKICYWIKIYLLRWLLKDFRGDLEEDVRILSQERDQYSSNHYGLDLAVHEAVLGYLDSYLRYPKKTGVSDES